ALGHLAAAGTAAAGAPVAATAGAAVVVVTFALLARPLGLAELDALLTRVRRRVTRTRTRS
ncbi:murein biosynthesis integral membrane protein MurJ, partial [Streptomyces bacillaris]